VTASIAAAIAIKETSGFTFEVEPEVFRKKIYFPVLKMAKI
jgi:hypothetical protein